MRSGSSVISAGELNSIGLEITDIPSVIFSGELVKGNLRLSNLGDSPALIQSVRCSWSPAGVVSFSDTGKPRLSKRIAFLTANTRVGTEQVTVRPMASGVFLRQREDLHLDWCLVSSSQRSIDLRLLAVCEYLPKVSVPSFVMHRTAGGNLSS